MSTKRRRSTIALLLAVSIAAAVLVVGGAAGQTATEPQPTETPTGAVTGTPTAGTPAVTGTATPADEADDQNLAYLRVAHVSPDAPSVDVFVDGERVLADVSFGAVSDYLALSAGEHDLRISPAGDSETTVFEGNVTLEPRSTTTLFAAGEVDENATEPFAPILFEDDPIRPAEDEAAVSIAHMSPDAPTVDVTANDGSVLLADDLSYREASQYVTVPAGTHTVEVRPATETDDAEPVATLNVSLEGERAYSAIAVGSVNESAEGEAFDVLLVEDASKTIHLPAEEGGNETPTVTPATETPGDGVTTEPAGEETTVPGETPTETVGG